MALTWVVAILCIVASATVWCSASASSGEIGARRRSWRSESYRQARLLIARLLFSSRSVPLILAASPSYPKSSPLRDSCPSARLSSLQSRLYSAASVQSRDTNPPRESFACGPYAVGHRARRPIPASTMLNGFASSPYPHCGQDAATFETGPRVSGDRCARRSAHNRRHAA